MDDFGMGYALGQDSNGGNDGGMWGGNGSWIFAFLIIALIFGGNGWGFGNGGANGAGLQGALTRGDLCSEFNFNDLQRSVAGVQQGLCDGFYAMNTGMLNGFAGVDNAVCQLGYQTAQLANGINVNMMQGFNGVTAGLNSLATQLASCCCGIERAIDGVNYNMATNTCALQTALATSTRDIIDSQQAGTRAILDYLCQEKIADLQSENQSLKLSASQAAQNNYLISQLRPCPQPAYITCNPFTGLYGGYSQDGYGRGSCGGCGGCC